MNNKDLKIALIGTGKNGRTHMDRINNQLQGGKVVACADPVSEFGMSIAKDFSVKGYENPVEMINDPEFDAILITAGDDDHEKYLLASIEAGKYVFCEKPLAPKVDACRRIVEAEINGGKKLVQVGFMRRYDSGYKQLKHAIEKRIYGEPLLLHCAHRNPSVPEDYDTPMAVENSMIHEIDVLRWLLNEDFATAEVRFGKDTKRTHKNLRDPQVMILTTESGVRIDVEAFVNNGNNYEIKSEVVCEDAVLNLPEPSNIIVTANATKGLAIHNDWTTRFVEAYNDELQSWINATKEDRVDGPTAWDGYVGQFTAAAASKARDLQEIVTIECDSMPDFYK